MKTGHTEPKPGFLRCLIAPTCRCSKSASLTHLVVDIFLVIVVFGLVMGNLIFLSRARQNLQPSEGKFRRVGDVPLFSVKKGNVPIIENESPLYSGQSMLVLQAQALYFSAEGEQIGRGPWPPKPGETTNLKVLWKISAQTGAGGGQGSGQGKWGGFNSVMVSGKLGPGVEWTGFAPIGQGIIYEPDTRLVRWFVDKLESNTLENAVFDVAITPEQPQLQDGQLLIMEEIRMQGTEQTTGQIREIFVPNVVVFLDLE